MSDAAVVAATALPGLDGLRHVEERDRNGGEPAGDSRPGGPDGEQLEQRRVTRGQPGSCGHPGLHVQSKQFRRQPQHFLHRTGRLRSRPHLRALLSSSGHRPRWGPTPGWGLRRRVRDLLRRDRHGHMSAGYFGMWRGGIVPLRHHVRSRRVLPGRRRRRGSRPVIGYPEPLPRSGRRCAPGHRRCRACGRRRAARHLAELSRDLVATGRLRHVRSPPRTPPLWRKAWAAAFLRQRERRTLELIRTRASRLNGREVPWRRQAAETAWSSARPRQQQETAQRQSRLSGRQSIERSRRVIERSQEAIETSRQTKQSRRPSKTSRRLSLQTRREAKRTRQQLKRTGERAKRTRQQAKRTREEAKRTRPPAERTRGQSTETRSQSKRTRERAKRTRRPRSPTRLVSQSRGMR